MGQANVVRVVGSELMVLACDDEGAAADRSFWFADFTERDDCIRAALCWAGGEAARLGVELVVELQ